MGDGWPTSFRAGEETFLQRIRRLVRIKMMRICFPLVCVVLLFHLPTFGEQDARVTEALFRLTNEASRLWQTAPAFIAREKVNQKVLARNRSHFRIGADAVKAEPMFQTREIQSFYGFGTLPGAPEALREFREMYAVDGSPVEDENKARAKFVATMTGGDGASKQALITEFEKTCVAGSATDFGQLILLFTKTNVGKYTYALTGDTRLGVDTAWLIQFKQQAGSQSLHIAEGRKKISEKLNGEVWVRQGDYLPLRIVLTSTRKHDKNEVRDEAKVDYTVVSGALLPAALVYRHFLNDEMVLESIYRYSDWQPVAPK